LEDNSCKNIF